MSGRAWRTFRRNRLALTGAVIMILLSLAALLAPWLAPHDPLRGNLRDRLTPPGSRGQTDSIYLLGTDGLGRDLLSRILYGGRVSIVLGLLVVGVSITLGVTLGLVSGYVGGVLDTVLGRLVDVLLSFPYLVLAIALMGLLGPGFSNLVVALAVKEWVIAYRIVRSETLTLKHAPFVEASRALGASPARILFRHLLVNVLPGAAVVATLRIGWIVLLEASLSFLGLGIQPPQPSWGVIIADGRDLLFRAWWISTFPGIAIFLFVLGVNLLGEGLRDALDPRLATERIPE